jgi:hypothetical protein
VECEEETVHGYDGAINIIHLFVIKFTTGAQLGQAAGGGSHARFQGSITRFVSNVNSNAPHRGVEPRVVVREPARLPQVREELPAHHVVAMQVEEDSLLIGRLIHHSAFSLADKLFQPIRRGRGGSAEFNVQIPTTYSSTKCRHRSSAP